MDRPDFVKKYKYWLLTIYICWLYDKRMRKQAVTFFIEADEYAKLKVLASALGVSVAAYMRIVLKRHSDKKELVTSK